MPEGENSNGAGQQHGGGGGSGGSSKDDRNLEHLSGESATTAGFIAGCERGACVMVDDPKTAPRNVGVVVLRDACSTPCAAGPSHASSRASVLRGVRSPGKGFLVLEKVVLEKANADVTLLDTTPRGVAHLGSKVAESPGAATTVCAHKRVGSRLSLRKDKREEKPLPAAT